MKPTTDGSYHCSCGAGYENVNSTHIGTALDGTECQNINECTTGDNECDVNAHCTDSVGGYTCEYLGGWTGDGRTCMDHEECKNIRERNVSTLVQNGSMVTHMAVLADSLSCQIIPFKTVTNILTV